MTTATVTPVLGDLVTAYKLALSLASEASTTINKLEASKALFADMPEMIKGIESKIQAVRAIPEFAKVLESENAIRSFPVTDIERNAIALRYAGIKQVATDNTELQASIVEFALSLVPDTAVNDNAVFEYRIARTTGATNTGNDNGTSKRAVVVTYLDGTTESFNNGSSLAKRYLGDTWDYKQDGTKGSVSWRTKSAEIMKAGNIASIDSAE